MRAKRLVAIGFGSALVLLIVIAGFGQAVLQLWNWLVPGLFGLRPLTFWQAVGLMALSWILFGGLRGFGFHGPMRRGWSERWNHMSPEEREKVRQALESRAGKCGPPA
jgi:hypothetical protein